MTKKNIRKRSLATIFMSAFATVIVIQAIAATALFLTPLPVQAAGNKDFSMNLAVPLPTLNGGNAHIKFTGDTGPIAAYIKAIYNFAVGAVGIVAAVVLMIGGLMWITAGGNASTVTEAKSMITAAITGLVLVLTSYLLLSQVNPALVNLSADINGIVKPEVKQDGDTASQVAKLFGDKCVWQTPPSTETAKCPEFLTKWTDGTTCEGNKKMPPDVIIPQVCCCPPPNNSCLNCSNIGDAGIPIANDACCTTCATTIPCQASIDLISKLLTFKKDAYDNWQVTGAAPPTPGIHRSSCHTSGSCVDINSSNVQKLYEALKGPNNPSLPFQYECTDSDSCCTSLFSYMGTSCKDKSTDPKFDATANHFHVGN
jgi:hypothetical protein